MNPLNDSQIVIRLPKELREQTEYCKDVLHITTSQFIRVAITNQINKMTDKTIRMNYNN